MDPSLPGPILAARLDERSNCRIEDITHVFLTSFTPDHCRGISLFDDATWLIHEPEKTAVESDLAEHLARAEEAGDTALEDAIQDQQALLQRCTIADTHILPGVDLFPLPGASPGCCGLLIPLPARTVLLAGDAIATREHLERRQVLPTCTDHDLAMESFRDGVEISDVIVPGRDNLLLNTALSFWG